jgi:FMN-dependent NADH-azoreductase
MVADVWGADLTVVERELTLAEVTPAMEPLRPLAAQMHEKAREAALTVGPAFAAGRRRTEA